MNENLYGPEGLSSTEANKVAEKAKKMADEAERAVDRLCPVNSFIVVDGQRLPKQSASVPADLMGLIGLRGEIHGLIGYLREAVRGLTTERDRISKEGIMTFLTPEEAALMARRPQEYTPKKRPYVKEPTEQEVMNGFSAEDFAEFVRAQALAASLGKTIYPSTQPLPSALNVKNDIEWVREGGTAYPVIVEEAVSREGLLQVWVHAQTLHAESQSQANYFLARIKNEYQVRLRAVLDLNRDITEQNQRDADEAYRRLELEVKKLQAESDVLIMTARQRKSDALQKIAALKIVIPTTLEPLLRRVQEWDGTIS